MATDIIQMSTSTTATVPTMDDWRAPESVSAVHARVHQPKRTWFMPAFGFPPTWERRIALAIIVLQAVWAIAIPIKNVVMMTDPEFRADSVSSENHAYAFSPAEHATPLVVSGSDLVPLLRRVLFIAIGDRSVRENFESAGSFDIDTVYQLLSPEDFHVMSQYYAVLTQASAFPGTVLTPRPRYFAATTDLMSLSQDALGVWIRPTDPNASDWFLPISCAAERAKVDGTRCFQRDTTHVCYDFPVPGESRRYEQVELDSLRSANTTGFANNIGQLYLIEMFHRTMNAVFSTKSWRQALDAVEYTVDTNTALASAFVGVFNDADGRPLVLEKNVRDYSLPLAAMNTTRLESCVVAEIVSSRFYMKVLTLQLIQTALLTFDVYNPSDVRVHVPNQTAAIVAPTLAHDLFLTSGARVDTLSHEGSRQFGSRAIASVTTAGARLKLDTKFNGKEVLGASVRMLMYMASYPEYYSYMHHEMQAATSDEHGAVDVISYSILGSAGSGLNTFRDNWWANTMGVYRLAELPSGADLESTARIDTWWDDETVFANWFAALERSPAAPFHLLDAHLDIVPRTVIVNDDPATACHRALFKTLTKLTFLSLLSFSQLPSYAVFMSNVNGGAPTWFKNTMLRFEMYGELPSGDRIAFSFSDSSTRRKDDGSAWVAIPMLHAMLQSFGRNDALWLLASEFNRSFAALVSTEYGLVHLPDMAQCQIGFATADISAADNTIPKIADKLYKPIMAFFRDLLTAIPALNTQMAAGIECYDGVEMVEIRDELLRGSPATFGGDPSSGSPVFWAPTAFTAGMLKLWPRTTPPQSVVDAYRNATTCYTTLELRYLNTSVRCWVEPNHVHRLRIEHKSVLMAKIIFSIWSTSLVLNAVALCIAARFLARLGTAWRVTKFRCVGLWVALQFNLQGFGVLSFSQTLLLTLSTVPLLVGYHIPVDSVFIVNQGTQEYSKLFQDVLVTLSASWFYRLAFEATNHFVTLEHVSFWFSNFRLRALAMLLVFVLRIATPDRMHSSTYEFTKLLLTCGGSAALGVASALLPVVRQRQSRHSTVAVAAVAPMELKRQSIVVASIRKHGLPLNKYGLVGFSQRGWSLAGLIVEGWDVVVKHRSNSNTTSGGNTDSTKPKQQQFVAVKGVCRIPLAVDERGEIKCLL